MAKARSRTIERPQTDAEDILLDYLGERVDVSRPAFTASPPTNPSTSQVRRTSTPP